MSLVKSLNSGVSGLKAFQTKMDTIGNNIANVETAGFKSSRVSFAEMMSEKLGRSGGGDSAPQLSNEVGLGVRVASIDRDFSQGAMQSTGRATDLAIEGEGYFMVSNGSEQLMTRAGNFVFNKDGHLVDQGGRYVQGYMADDNGNVLGGGAAENVRVDFENVLPPQKTENVTIAGNLNANTSTSQVIQAQSGFTEGGAPAADDTDINNLTETQTALDPGDIIEFDVTLNDGITTDTYQFTYGGANDGTTLEEMVTTLNAQIPAGEGEFSLVDGMLVLRSNDLGDSGLEVTGVTVPQDGGTPPEDKINFPGFQTVQEGKDNTQTMSTTVYDDLGKAHSLLLEFTQINDNEWSYDARFLDGEEISTGQTGTVEFDELGQLSTIYDETGTEVSGSMLNLSFEPGGGASASNFNIQLGNQDSGTKLTQFAGSNSAKVVGQDGYTQGELIDVAINGDGQVSGVYDNGENQVLAQLALGTVQNQNGLEMVGGGLFRATSAAGEMFVGTADNMSNTNINSGSLEGSNVDLAKEFTDMITSQRAYQSSARVISTSDEMLTEAVNLKR